MLKYPRIAVTALSLTACVLLIALWVRSYWWEDDVFGGFVTSSKPSYYTWSAFMWGSADGIVGFAAKILENVDEDKIEWSIHSERLPRDIQRGDKEPWRFEHEEVLVVNVPHWFLVALSAVSGICPWIHWSKRFSLRTLLIATTLVAAGLGAIVWSM